MLCCLCGSVCQQVWIWQKQQSADILVKLLLRLDQKLTVGGVDDSNGIVWPLISEIAELLIEYA